MLKLYKRWDAGILARLRPWLDEERLRLGTALRALASAHVTQSEDAILLFLERLAGQEAIVSIAGEELEALGEVKQAVLRARRPTMKLRGHRPRMTNLSPVRVQALLVMLEAVEPPVYAVTRMFYPAAGEDLTELLEYVVIQTYGNWGRLALETRDAVLRTLNTVRAGMVREGEGYTVNVRNVVEALHQFEAMPETLYFARNAFLNGKIDAPPPAPPRLNSQAPITDRLAELLTNPPPLTGEPVPPDRRQGVQEPRRQPEPPPQEPPAPPRQEQPPQTQPPQPQPP
ncbi:MAG TPA: hypothetical protein VNK95_00530, partial [Caldilineaceae bacterium]|nr:hypothetical protein [Caldilineaceae bacterium]